MLGYRGRGGDCGPKEVCTSAGASFSVQWNKEPDASEGLKVQDWYKYQLH